MNDSETFKKSWKYFQSSKKHFRLQKFLKFLNHSKKPINISEIFEIPSSIVSETSVKSFQKFLKSSSIISKNANKDFTNLFRNLCPNPNKDYNGSRGFKNVSKIFKIFLDPVSSKTSINISSFKNLARSFPKNRQ